MMDLQRTSANYFCQVLQLSVQLTLALSHVTLRVAIERSQKYFFAVTVVHISHHSTLHTIMQMHAPTI